MVNTLKAANEKISLSRILSNNFYILKCAFNIFPLYYSFYILSSILTTTISNLYSVLIVKYIIDSVTNTVSFYAVIKLLLYAGLIMTINTIIREATGQLSNVKNKELNGKIQQIIMKKASEMDIIYYDKTEFYDEFMRANTKTEWRSNNSIKNIVNLISQAVSILTISAVIMSISPIIVIFPITAFILNLITSACINKLNYMQDLELDPFNREMYYSRRVFYMPDYSKELRLTKIKDPIFRQFESSIDAQKAVIKKYGLKIALLSLCNSALGMAVCVFYFPPLYLSYSVMVTKKIKMGDFASMNNTSQHVYNRLNSISSAITTMQQIGLYTEHFRNFLELQPNIENTIGSALVPLDSKEIKIENLSFKYDDTSKFVLKDINITIKPNEKIAIVGHNGAGKSTFIKLLMRLYEPTSGKILYDGTDIKDYSIKAYRNIFGAVFQDFQIYASTLAENVMMGYTSKENKLEAQNAINFVGLDEKVNSLKLGIDTPLTREFEKEGTMLSGGQSQKLAISRIFVKNHSIAILDEPSSALDPIAEYDLNKSMLEAAKDNTVIFISHRLSTTRMADKIYMFEGGKIIEQGSHEELMKLDGAYADMFRKQAHYYKD